MTPAIEALEALARRAVACRGWRWMPGMLTLSDERMLDDGWPEYDVLEYGSSGVAECVKWNLKPKKGALPDLTDPATLGCLLALVREAWMDPEAHPALGGAGWILMSGESRVADVVLCSPAGRTEAEALVAALEAALTKP
jgi:hypothetical protein